MFDFVNNKFGLHTKTPSVVIDGVSYEISGKTFDELEQDVRSEILQYRFQTYQLEGCTMQDIEETFARLNGGTLQIA